MAASFQLKPSPKIYKNYKSAFPSQTILSIKEALRKIGIESNKLKHDWGKINLGNFSVYTGQIFYNNRYVCSGKGISYQLLEASAYGELIERIPLNISPLVPCINLGIDIERGSYLRGYISESPERVKNNVDIGKFFSHFPLMNIKKFKQNDLCKYWVDAFSLTAEKYKKVPHLLISAIAGSNGCAAGNTPEEAISQAFCEICERCSLTEHILRKQSVPTIDPGSIEDKTIRQAIELFNSMNVDVEIKDFTLGNKLPVMGVLFTNQNLAHEKDNLKKRLFFKTLTVGSHLDLNQALLRCFTERMQIDTCDVQNLMYHREFDILKNYFPEKAKRKIMEDLIKREFYHPLVTSWRSFDSFDYLNRSSPVISFENLLSHRTADFLEDIEIIKNISKKNHWETMIIDYSIPELPLRVVRAVVPSVSDLLRLRCPSKGNPFLFCNQKKTLSPDTIFENKKGDIKQLIPVLENYLASNIVWPQPSKIVPSPKKILFALLSLCLLIEENKKSSHIFELLNEISEDNFDNLFD